MWTLHIAGHCLCLDDGRSLLTDKNLITDRFTSPCSRRTSMDTGFPVYPSSRQSFGTITAKEILQIPRSSKLEGRQVPVVSDVVGRPMHIT